MPPRFFAASIAMRTFALTCFCPTYSPQSVGRKAASREAFKTSGFSAELDIKMGCVVAFYHTGNHSGESCLNLLSRGFSLLSFAYSFGQGLTASGDSPRTFWCAACGVAGGLLRRFVHPASLPAFPEGV